MSNKIKDIFRLKGMILKNENSEYNVYNESNEQLLCSINFPDQIFLDHFKGNVKISIDKKKKIKKRLKRKLGFFSSFLSENLRLRKKLITRRINLVGTGFKVFGSKQDNSELIFKIGLSHLVKVFVPKNISFEITKINEIKFQSYDKELLGSFLNYVASIRFPDSYKGRGLTISNKAQMKLKKGKVKN